MNPPGEVLKRAGATPALKPSQLHTRVQYALCGNWY